MTLVYRGELPLRGFEDDLRHGVVEALAARGVNFIFNDTFSRIDKAGSVLSAHTKGGAVLEADQILFAIGRSPNTKGLAPEQPASP